MSCPHQAHHAPPTTHPPDTHTHARARAPPSPPSTLPPARPSAPRHDPRTTYAGKGWKGTAHWLGTGAFAAAAAPPSVAAADPAAAHAAGARSGGSHGGGGGAGAGTAGTRPTFTAAPTTCSCKTPDMRVSLFCDECDEVFALCCTGLAEAPLGGADWLCAGCSATSAPQPAAQQPHQHQHQHHLECVVCLHNPRGVLLRPCNHLVLCTACAEPYDRRSSTASAARCKDCPICRVAVESTHAVHTAGQVCHGKGCGQGAPCSVVLRPCGHMCLCQGCAADLLGAVPPAPLACPVCGADVHGYWGNVVVS